MTNSTKAATPSDALIRLLLALMHEITEPLAGIMINANTCLRTLARDPPSLDGARAAARRALRDVERAQDLITRLRVLVGKNEATSESLDLNVAIREALALLSGDPQKQRLVLRTESAGDDPE
jgi:signal transduction histidine kinase